MLRQATALKRASASCSKQHECLAPRFRRAARVSPAVKSAALPGAFADPDLFTVVSAVCDNRPGSDDAGLIAQEASLAFHYLSQANSLPTAWQPVDLVNRAFELTDLLATGSTFRTLQMLKRHPNLLLLSPCQVASKVLQLKLLMPPANIAELLYQKPTLLMLDDIPAVLGPALNKLHMLMPGIPVEKKLHEGGTVFCFNQPFMPEAF
eukprot:gene14596-14727_t